MKHKRHYRAKGRRAKRTLRLPDLEHAKAAVLNSLTNADAQRGYQHAIDEFVDWYCSEPRLAFNRTVVLRYRGRLDWWELAPDQSTFGSAQCAVLPMRLPIVAYSAPISSPAFVASRV